MKNLSLSLVSFLLLVWINVAAFAENTPAAAYNQSNSQSASTTPPLCRELTNICQVNGYVLKGPPGKNAWFNCVAPLLNNKAVPKLIVKPEVVESCRAEFNNLPCVKLLNNCHAAGFNDGPGKLAMFDCVLPLYQGKQVPGVHPDPNVLNSCRATLAKSIADQPCFRVMMACNAAGFSPDQVSGTKFARNCFNPTINGQQVAGVVIDAATAQACKKQMTPANNTSPTL